MQEATVQLKTVFSAKVNSDASEALQEFIIWFMENLSIFPELFSAESEYSASAFSIKLEE